MWSTTEVYFLSQEKKSWNISDMWNLRGVFHYTKFYTHIGFIAFCVLAYRLGNFFWQMEIVVICVIRLRTTHPGRNNVTRKILNNLFLCFKYFWLRLLRSEKPSAQLCLQRWLSKTSKDGVFATNGRRDVPKSPLNVFVRLLPLMTSLRMREIIWILGIWWIRRVFFFTMWAWFSTNFRSLIADH